MKREDKTKIGVFGGTFDPFTPAHFEIVRKILADKIVNKVIVIPTIVDYYRKGKTEMFDLSERRRIIEKWFEGIEDVILDFHEYKLATNTKLYYDDPQDIHKRRYIHMLEDIKFRYDKDDRIEFLTVIGGDSWNHLKSWYKYEDLLKMSEFIVARREGNDLQTISVVGKIAEHGYTPKHIIELDTRFESMSATAIRNRISEEMDGMGMGPRCTCLDIYLEEIEMFKKEGETIEEHVKKIDNLMNDAVSKMHKEKAESALVEIGKILTDFRLTAEDKLAAIIRIVK